MKAKKQIGLLFLPVLLMLSVCNKGYAQKDTGFTVQLNKNVFTKGDSIMIDVNLSNYTAVAKTATVQLWIENRYRLAAAGNSVTRSSMDTSV